jgi:hypothetical protein
MITQYEIKALALILMLVDHAGLLLEVEWLRIIGRLSFPLFCWVLARNWERKTEESTKRLVIRLGIFGIISQLPYMAFTGRSELNILMSFLITILTFREVHRTKHKIVMIIIGMVAAQCLNVSYGWFAILCPLLMLNFKQAGTKGWWFVWTSANIAFTITAGNLIQIFTIFAPLILMQYNPKNDMKPGRIEKYFFYSFYPLHLIGLVWIKSNLM